MASDIERSRQHTMQQVAKWTSFYRANPQRFVGRYLHIKLKWFQQIIIYMMMHYTNIMYIASRGQGKTFLLAVFAVTKAILFPNSYIVICSKTKAQGNEVLTKIVNILCPQSELLKSEIDWKHSSITGQDRELKFLNGSTITVVVSNQNARHYRATVLIIDEYRMVPPDILQNTLKRFLATPRQPGFITKPEYSGKQEYLEPNQQLYCSSAWMKNSWSFDLAKNYCANMLDDTKKYFICSLPYQLAIREGLLSRAQIEDELSESGTFSMVTFTMEMLALFWGESEQGFFHFDEIEPDRKIMYPWFSNDLILKGQGLTELSKHFKIPAKLKGEKRILAVDLALMATQRGHNNDATSLFMIQLSPSLNNKYMRNVVYADCFEGMHTSDQALIIRKLFAEYQCDYIVIDCRGVGAGIVDLLFRSQYDSSTGIEWPALASCIDLMSERNLPNAEKVIWPIAASSQFNSECALGLRECLRNGSLRLLISEWDADDQFQAADGFTKLDLSLQQRIRMPYIHTSLLINELVNLETEVKNGIVRVKEKSGMRKDRYSSLSYGMYVTNQLERKLVKKVDTSEFDNLFSFKRPQII